MVVALPGPHKITLEGMSLSLWHCGRGRTVVVALPGPHKITLEGMSLSLWHCGRGRTVIVALPGPHKITLEGMMTVQSACWFQRQPVETTAIAVVVAEQLSLCRCRGRRTGLGELCVCAF